MGKRTAIVVGVGAEQGLGSALCQKFAAEGYHVFAVGRTEGKVAKVVGEISKKGGSAEALLADATQEDDILALFEKTFVPRENLDPPDLIVFNAGNNRKIPFQEVSVELFEDSWRVGCFAGFLVGREAARRLVPLGRGTIIFTGASASLRGKAGFAQFSAAKAGLRMISQSMAREFGPQGIHVAHVVIDGGINGERLRVGRPELFAEQADARLLNIDAIAESYWQLHRQHPTAWSQEIDLRPAQEVF
jgi:NAD(P)-dependent dehydrogenase (short-subunit alcohol dehydrogenase family)